MKPGLKIPAVRFSIVVVGRTYIGSLKTKCPYTRKKLHHEETTEDKADNAKGLLCFWQLLLYALTLATGVLTDVQADEEVGEDTAHVQGNEKQYGIMPVF